MGVTVVGVRNEKGVKEDKLPQLAQKLAVDDEDVIRNQIGIKKDLLGLLGGRETYVISKNGKVEYKFNDQFNPEKMKRAGNTLRKPLLSNQMKEPRNTMISTT